MINDNPLAVDQLYETLISFFPLHVHVLHWELKTHQRNVNKRSPASGLDSTLLRQDLQLECPLFGRES